MKLLNLFDLLLELEFCIGSSSNLQFNLIFIPSIFSKKIFHHLYWIFKYTFDNSFTCSTSNINFLGVNNISIFRICMIQLTPLSLLWRSMAPTMMVQKIIHQQWLNATAADDDATFIQPSALWAKDFEKCNFRQNWQIFKAILIYRKSLSSFMSF